MAILQITEFQNLEREGKGRDVMVGRLPAVATQIVTYTTETDSVAMDGKTRFVRLIADADAYVTAGDTPTATASSTRLKADVAEYFGVNPGDLISVYDGTS